MKNKFDYVHCHRFNRRRRGKKTKAKVANRIENESVNIQIILCLTDEEYFIY